MFCIDAARKLLMELDGLHICCNILCINSLYSPILSKFIQMLIELEEESILLYFYHFLIEYISTYFLDLGILDNLCQICNDILFQAYEANPIIDIIIILINNICRNACIYF